MVKELARRKALVLGVSSVNSVGGAVALSMVSEGWTVAIGCRPHKVEMISSIFTPRGVAHVLGVDASDPSSIDAGFTTLENEWGGLDALVHCLVACPSEVLSEPLTELSDRVFGDVMNVAVYSLIRACRNGSALMKTSMAPRVVTLLSESYHLMTPNYHVLGIAKAALRSAVSYLAYELGPSGILVNGVSFSLIATDGANNTIGADNAAATRKYLAKKAPLREPVGLPDVTDSILYFSSPNCRGTTGQVLTVDGGYSQLYF